jgi:lipopolysaccharide export LptBFGC system permease protein LptF
VLTAVVLLAAAAFGVRYRRAGRSAATACLIVLAVASSMLGYVASAGKLTTWPVLMAAALSTTRIGYTLSRLPHLLACC